MTIQKTLTVNLSLYFNTQLLKNESFTGDEYWNMSKIN